MAFVYMLTERQIDWLGKKHRQKLLHLIISNNRFLIFRLVCSKNSQSYGTTIDELWDSCDRLDVPLPQKGSIAPSSFCTARLKLDENVFKEINSKVIAAYAQDDKWLGH